MLTYIVLGMGITKPKSGKIDLILKFPLFKLLFGFLKNLDCLCT